MFKFLKNLKDKALQVALEKQLKNLPPEQREVIMALVEKHPGFFKQMNNEIQAKKKAGVPEQMASMQVMMAHRHEMEKLVRELGKK